jgi:hypothetical protein
MAALWTCVDAGRNSSGSELFSAEGSTTLDAYVKVLKSGLRYVGIICHGGVSVLVALWVRTNLQTWGSRFSETMILALVKQRL